ncbi:MAG TPA: ABC transporter permease [bacterium]|nr:ABC transporter permease [bacterium]HPQ67376.1 ABC transporter permease [bacterium]
MIAYAGRRVLLAIPTLLGVTLITFILTRALPGDPAYALVGQRAAPETIARARELMGLDRSLPGQYLRYLGNLSVVGPGKSGWPAFKLPYLGESYFTRRPVSELLAEKFPHTLRLAAAAMAVAVAAGIGLGLLSASFPGRLPDRIASLVAIGGISIPVFWTGLVLIMVFSYLLGWFPASGMGGGRLVYLVLPALTLGSRSAAYLARITRSSILEAAGRQYVVTARAKGLGGGKVLIRHMLRNALIPIVTLAALDFGSYLNGSVLTETIFGWDGVGRLVMTAIRRQDYPVILGGVLLGAVVFIAVNVLVDLSYALIDPRIRVGRKSR